MSASRHTPRAAHDLTIGIRGATPPPAGWRRDNLDSCRCRSADLECNGGPPPPTTSSNECCCVPFPARRRVTVRPGNRVRPTY